MPGARGYCFTLNNPDKHDLGHPDIMKHKFEKHEVTWAFWSLEVGQNGTPHYQGVLYFKAPRLMKAVNKKLFNNHAHLETKRGSVVANIHYISKDPIEGPWEHGDRPMQGKRSDWAEVRRMIKTGADNEKILDTFPHVFPNQKCINEYRLSIAKPYEGERKVIWNWGVTGAGKTYAAKQAGAVHVKYVGGSWRGYNGEECVVLDEMDKWDKVPWDEMLLMLDSNPITLNMRYFNLPWNAKTIYICTTTVPDTIIPGAWYDQMLRRITEVHHYTKTYSAVRTQPAMFTH